MGQREDVEHSIEQIREILRVAGYEMPLDVSAAVAHELFELYRDAYHVGRESGRRINDVVDQDEIPTRKTRLARVAREEVATRATDGRRDPEPA